MEVKTNQSQQIQPAKELSGEQRKHLALKIIGNEKPVNHLAEEQNVSPKFLYKQKAKAISAINQAFEEKKEDDKVLFYIPVTKAWLCQVVLALILNCHSSYRGVMKTFSDVFGRTISIGNVSNIVKDATSKASIINSNQDLKNVKNVRHGAHDEVFHGNKPVLTGVDIASLYCYLLSEEDHRDSDTWAIHLWDLVDQGFNPDYTIADFAKGLREGQAMACSEIPCNGDVFHISQDLQELKRYFKNRAKSEITHLIKVETKMEKAKKKGNARKHSKELGIAREKEKKIRELSNDINTLSSWMEHDVLKIAGSDPKTRRYLFDFIVDEIKKLELIHPHRIKTVRTTLENHRYNLLAFVDVLNEKFEYLSQKYDVPLNLIWNICELQRYSQECNTYYEKEIPLRKVLKHKFYTLQNDVVEAMHSTPKASSSAENLHSRYPHALSAIKITHI